MRALAIVLLLSALALAAPKKKHALPPLTVQMNRGDPFDQLDACGDGTARMLPGGYIDKVYTLWDRSPVTVKASYLASNGSKDKPAATTLASY